MNIYLLTTLVMVGAYLLGNTSPATILGKLSGINIKKEGSGNAGTTNVLRVLGKKAAIITLVIDIGKGFLAVYIASMILPWYIAMFSGLMVFLGHVWPILLKFQGGKGVATAFGVLLAVDWKMALLCLGIVIVVVLITKMVSLGSISAAIGFVGLSYWMDPDFLKVGILMSAILLYKHRSNIVRILKGQESKITDKKKK